MAKIILSILNYYSKSTVKIWRDTENHASAGDSEHITFNSQN